MEPQRRGSGVGLRQDGMEPQRRGSGVSLRQDGTIKSTTFARARAPYPITERDTLHLSIQQVVTEVAGRGVWQGLRNREWRGFS